MLKMHEETKLSEAKPSTVDIEHTIVATTLRQSNKNGARLSFAFFSC